MKNFILLCSSMFIVFSGLSQEKFLSKNGKPILPQKRDMSLGLDATPVIGYFGNMFNNNSDNTLGSIGSKTPLTISGKYFLQDKFAIRGFFGVGYSNLKVEELVTNLSSNDTLDKVSDETSDNSLNLKLGVGLEYRRGFGRLQAFYGPQLQIGFSSSSTQYSYGNDLSDIAPSGRPSSATRISEVKEGALLSVEVGGFAGVEYFFAPRISLSTEVGISLKYETKGEGEEILETFERSTLIIIPIVNRGETSTSTPGYSLLQLDTTPNASIAINFYF